MGDLVTVTDQDSPSLVQSLYEHTACRYGLDRNLIVHQLAQRETKCRCFCLFYTAFICRACIDRISTEQDYSLQEACSTPEDTPFLLVSTFFIVSTAIFCMCNEAAIEVFYFFFMATDFYIAATCMVESFLGLTPLARPAAALEIQRGDRSWKHSDDQLPIIDLVIVAYLPNEQDIIRDQVLYAVEELEYPKDRLRVNLVYNTNRPIEPLESELHDLQNHISNLVVMKVPKSKSKADNLNHFFTLNTGADIIGVFDSDHSPYPHNPRWAAQRFLDDPTISIVQGHCVVHNTANLPSRLFNFGLFCGSNGYWRADLLKGHKMHGEMLTEDIDSALRAHGEGKRAVHDMNVTGFEMVPNKFQAFWKQRLRWAQGWTQASIVHLPLAWTNPPPAEDGTIKHRTVSERFEAFPLACMDHRITHLYPGHVLIVCSYYLGTLHTCLLLSFVIVDWSHNVDELVRLLFFRYPMSEWFFFATIIALLFTLYFTEKVRLEFTTRWMMVVFCIIYIPYLVLLAVMGLYGHAR
ncbi:glycosyltransferase family 2 protein [Teratosphaeria destructans]|uniref:Glycosyltransferase family 2 protein n=1 Tax=Teratosphaeria destructans TaxID=418781 RepID=A0A9W7VZ08_9PEZI|nr:glycosyltransferase family 2 protein [Teratosphaeria destructans]